MCGGWWLWVDKGHPRVLEKASDVTPRCSFGFEEYERTRWKGVNRLPPCGWKLLVPLTAFLIL